MTEFTLHGADPLGMYQLFGLEPPAEIIDFSTNTNALSYEKPLTIDFLTAIGRYPQEEGGALKALLARENGCRQEEVFLCNGSNEAIYIIASYFVGKRAAILEPTYGEYRRALTAYGVEISPFFQLNDCPTDVDVVFICNPNNPTGHYRPLSDLAQLIAARPETLFVIDEAYRDFLPFWPETLDFAVLGNVCLLRSLTKIFHLAGLRIGYLLAPATLVARWEERQPSWSVNGPAQIIAAQFLQDKDFIGATKAFYATERPRLIHHLRHLGYEVRDSDVNFFLLSTADDWDLMAFLLARGLVPRHTRNYLTLKGKYLRLAVKTAAENEALVAALTTYRR